MPGPACQLVVIDRIPFPRPDDPLMSARSQAVADAGGNGFMTVAATYAALRMAQGSGRLVRHADDRGVVAVLDSRLATARYGGFLRSSLPPFWPTADKETALGALRRLDATAGELRPVHEPGLRSDALREGGPVAAAEPPVAADPAPVPEATRTAVVGGRAWTADDDTLLREGVDLGCSVDDLADQFECDVEVVELRLDALGLSAPRELF